MNTQQIDSYLHSTRNTSDRSVRSSDENWSNQILLLETGYLAYEDDGQVIDEHIRGISYTEGF